MKALVSTEQISKEGMKQLELIDNMMTILEEQIREEKQATHQIQETTLDKTPSLEDGWKESCDLPSGWMAKEKQHDLKKDKVSNPDETSSLEDDWKEGCCLPIEAKSQEAWQGSGDQHNTWNIQEEQLKWEEEKAVLEENKVRLKLHQESMDEEEKVTEEIDASLKRLFMELSYLEEKSYPHDPGPEEEDQKSSLEVGWQESCILPSVWMSQEKQQTSNEDQGPQLKRSPAQMMLARELRPAWRMDEPGEAADFK